MSLSENEHDNFASSQPANKSLAKVMMVLNCFSRQEVNLTPAEIAARTGMPRTTTQRLLASLRDIGLLEQHYRRDSYRLGMRLFQLGSLVLSNMDLDKHAPPYVTQLQQLTGEDIHLAIFDGSQMVIVERQEMAPSLNNITHIEGSPLYCTGVGKACLAFQPPSQLERVIEEGFVAFTPGTLVDGAALRQEMALIRERGFAIDNEECELNRRCVAAPIRDSGGNVFGSISVTGPAERMPLTRLNGLAPTLMQTADAISRELGWRAG